MEKIKNSFFENFKFNRVELAGSFGDLGTLLPIVMGMIMINHLSPSSVFLSFGLLYIVTGFYFKLPVPVQPLKAVGAIAIAYPALITESVISASGIIFGSLMLLFYFTGLVDKLAKLFTQPVVRGIQLALGLVFLRKGIELIVNKNLFMSDTPAKLAGLNLNLIIGVLVFVMVLVLLDNKRLPAAMAAVGAGILVGLCFGGFKGQNFSLGPTDIRLILPSANDFWIAFSMLILPQIPLTIGNSCVGTADTCSILFPDNPLLKNTKAGNFALTMGLVNLPAGFLGAVPMCHGTGGLAAHYRFGARTGGAPLMIGALLLLTALLFGEFGFAVLAMIPNSVLGVLLIFAGLELCPLIRSLKTNEEYFVALLISGISLAVPNMGWAFGIGILVDFIIKKTKIKI
jgi:SulP family sulfate permease